MPADHREKAFEAAIENHLVTSAGYPHGDNREYRAALITAAITGCRCS
jgi:hypothetical protein